MTILPVFIAEQNLVGICYRACRPRRAVWLPLWKYGVIHKTGSAQRIGMTSEVDRDMATGNIYGKVRPCDFRVMRTYLLHSTLRLSKNRQCAQRVLQRRRSHQVLLSTTVNWLDSDSVNATLYCLFIQKQSSICYAQQGQPPFSWVAYRYC